MSHSEAALTFEESELPQNATIQGIQVAPKPNGKKRIILNSSLPEGISTNDGISKEEYPSKMDGTKEWLMVLNLLGWGCVFFKIDWISGIIHI